MYLIHLYILGMERFYFLLSSGILTKMCVSLIHIELCQKDNSNMCLATGLMDQTFLIDRKVKIIMKCLEQIVTFPWQELSHV